MYYVVFVYVVVDDFFSFAVRRKENEFEKKKVFLSIKSFSLLSSKYMKWICCNIVQVKSIILWKVPENIFSLAHKRYKSLYVYIYSCF